MADRSTFSEDEWGALHRGLTGAALLVSVSDKGLLDSFREAGALGRHLADARREGSSELVRELAEERGLGFSVRTNPEELDRETMEALREAVATLEAKAPEDLEEYRRFVLEVAQSVADAAGGGEQSESATLARIRAALGASQAA